MLVQSGLDVQLRHTDLPARCNTHPRVGTFFAEKKKRCVYLYPFSYMLYLYMCRHAHNQHEPFQNLCTAIGQSVQLYLYFSFRDASTCLQTEYKVAFCSRNDGGPPVGYLCLFLCFFSFCIGRISSRSRVQGCVQRTRDEGVRVHTSLALTLTLISPNNKRNITNVARNGSGDASCTSFFFFC